LSASTCSGSLVETSSVSSTNPDCFCRMGSIWSRTTVVNSFVLPGRMLHSTTRVNIGESPFAMVEVLGVDIALDTQERAPAHQPKGHPTPNPELIQYPKNGAGLRWLTIVTAGVIMFE